jgi:hypothetical protein
METAQAIAATSELSSPWHDHRWRQVGEAAYRPYPDYSCSTCGITWSL